MQKIDIDVILFSHFLLLLKTKEQIIPFVSRITSQLIEQLRKDFSKQVFCLELYDKYCFAKFSMSEHICKTLLSPSITRPSTRSTSRIRLDKSFS